MALRNATYDLSPETRAAVLAADIDGRTAARAGDPTIQASESAVIADVFKACRGRGIESPVAILLAAYDQAMGSPLFSLTTAKACAATPGTLDESRSTMNT